MPAMARRTRTSDQAAPKKRDAERTRARLLAVAVKEFAAHGFEGARVERVVRAANVTPRMLYHYFGNKEQLYVCVLDEVYAQIRAGERQLDLGTGDPVEALRRLAAYTFDFFQDNETFVQLTRAENMVAGRYIRRSRMIRDMSNPLIDAIEALLRRGEAAGAFRSGLDALQLYVSIVALSVHHINNVETLSAVFGADLSDAGWVGVRRQHAVDMVTRYVALEA